MKFFTGVWNKNSYGLIESSNKKLKKLSRYLCIMYSMKNLLTFINNNFQFELSKTQSSPWNNTWSKLLLYFSFNSIYSNYYIYEDLKLKCLYIAVDESSFYPKRIGSISKLTYHPLSGDLWAIDDNTLEFNEFTYDGQGPDAFFIIGLQTATSTPNPQGTVTRSLHILNEQSGTIIFWHDITQ